MASRTQPDPLEEVEAAVWRAGVTSRIAMERILQLVRAYGMTATCPTCPLQRRAILGRAAPDGRRR
jgi:hypothetical protein